MNIHSFLASLNPAKIKLGLDRTLALLQECGDPQNKLPTIQVAGTNGKGSVCIMLEKIYRTAGYKTGLFTSPHLNRINERIRINGKAIKDEKIINFLYKHRRAVISTDASFFETITAFSFWLFNKQQVDIAIMETGLGGLYDSVTVCSPIATTITKISFDHTNILGGTLKKIALQKAGIMKRNIPCFTMQQFKPVMTVLKNQALKIGCDLHVDKNINKRQVKLPGKHQQQNASLALSVVKTINNYKVSIQQISNALNSVVWFGRYQLLSVNPKIIFDVGHNNDGINAFLNTFNNENCFGKKHLLFALQGDKDIKKVSKKIINKFDHILCAEIHTKNFMPSSILFNKLGKPTNAITVGSINSSFLKKYINKIQQEDILCIVGTHYFGELISKVFNISFDNL